MKIGHFLHPQKEALTKDEKVSHENRKWAFVDGKWPHQILIGAFIGGAKGNLYKGDRPLIRKEKGHVSLLKGAFLGV